LEYCGPVPTGPAGTSVHAAVVVYQSSVSGEFFVWQKRGPGFPIEIRSLSNVLSARAGWTQHDYWIPEAAW